ncbi:hypothetical protein [Maribacter dokdonensis]|uniref:hypothetical protein n=1 Tax=Maribacter dokdonensis TaxID=320912 RepID=UPI0007198B74|nr:hypothetical protein [Maribacter dokdonensis]KSA14184.1 hypothetical protein I600_777 [Maribacter dokdonensis DSW-8]
MDNEQKKVNNLKDIAKIVLENTILKIDIEGQSKMNEALLEKIELNQNKYNEIFIENGKLRLQIEFIKDELKAKNVDEVLSIIRKLKDTLKDSNFHKKQYETLVREIDYVPVNQFKKLMWGDNYPSLKALFDYLQKMNCININWSCFADYMDYYSLNKINLQSIVLTKNDLGFILAKIEPFFLEEFKGKKSKYHNSIARKFTIDNVQINTYFKENYIRSYKTGSVPKTLRVKEIEELVLNIASKYK